MVWYGMVWFRCGTTGGSCTENSSKKTVSKQNVILIILNGISVLSGAVAVSEHNEVRRDK